MTRNVESGLRNYRIEFAREDTWAEFPTDPDFNLYSGVVSLFSWESDSEPNPRRGLGNVNPVQFQKGAESHTITVGYDLNKWLTNNGDPHDAVYDALFRDSDNQLENSHTIVAREEKSVVSEGSTVDGANGSRGTRIYTVGKGAYVDEATISGSADDVTVLSVELEYLAHKARSYQVDQPDGDQLAVQSTDAGDTTQEVTLETQDGSTSETLSLDGTTAVNTTDPYPDLAAIELSEQTQGDVEVYTWDDTAGETDVQLAVVHGADAYDGNEGDLGIPALGSGNREQEGDLPANYETFVGESIDRGAEPVPHEIQEASIVVSNEVEEIERTASYGMSLFPGNQELTLEATMFGERATHELLVDHLTNNAENVVWNLDSGDITLEGAVLSEPGERAAEEGEAVMTTDNVFTAKGVSVSEN